VDVRVTDGVRVGVFAGDPVNVRVPVAVGDDVIVASATVGSASA
jgi:hypothetical protein